MCLCVFVCVCVSATQFLTRRFCGFHQGDERVVMMPGKHLKDALLMVRPELQAANMRPVPGPELAMDILLFEQKLMVTNYKFGVLLVKKDQPDEVSW